MLLIRRSVLIIFFAVVILALIGTAVWAFFLTGGEVIPTSGELRYRAETLLFTSIVVSTVLTAVFAVIMIRSRNIDRMLNKLIKQNNMNPSSTKEGLLRLGKTGGKLNLLYRQIDEISEKRGLKISCMSEALKFYSDKLPEPVLLIDISGKIVQMSRGWAQHFGEKESVIGNSIESIFGEISLTDIILKLEKTHLPLKTVYNGITYNWTIIETRDRTPGYLTVMPSSGDYLPN